ncbi:replication-associated recombination protein A [Spiroplasma platyhelix]|uniref:Replication-associated recombination protein A n=1 Tax=Spiroplasma platyhelix PALS-1 TaxID=1276218 RepID=A0A846UDC1_9MOLU|nr:replication-associated recombination protein A [Spiroplasma platyhelix]MBE4704137.1 putative AAA domain-containing protein [Spiroplasma platyhelix PALS-1]NKE38508.1 replication-associated recombination protein A [Spiroplasma platyhelix PALS-1]UJB29395.1 recombination factor protein RarA [Spiroplasma platyhelix PALS-1]
MLEPLATILRPKTLTDVIGQTHLVNSENGVIFKIIEKQFLPSLVLHGLPGTGKTSLAQVIAQELKIPFAVFNAAIDKKQDLEKIFNLAKKEKNYLLIIEEIQRMNRDRQDLLLQYLEQGTFTLIACTSENPYFVVNPALRSRCLIVELKPISDGEMFIGLKRVIKENKIFKLNITDQALKMICTLASGDLRVAINILELSNNLYPKTKIDIKLISNIVPKASSWNFKEGNEHHDLKSALQKSIRGSDVDAAIYYLARLLASGDYEALLRRMLIIAYEDIALGNPAVCLRVQGAIAAFRQIGMPEGIIPLGLAVVEMALSEKSNSTNQAIQKAYQDVLDGKIYPIPDYLRSGVSISKKKNYKYPPNFKNSYVKQQYLPDELVNVSYYVPKDTSLYEKKINQLYQQFTNKIN